MKVLYSDLSIRFDVDGTPFSTLNIAMERMTETIPRHSHGNGSYEIHYIHSGYGAVRVRDELLPLTPRTLYVTGPFVEHEQFPRQEDPMVEYAIYFKIHHLESPADSVAYQFADRHYWFGTDTEDMEQLFQQLFYELEHQYVGYTNQVKALLQQCVVKMVRNYEKGSVAKNQFTAAGRFDSKYFFVEKTLLYEVESTTLESLSRDLGLSPRQTERFMKETYGKTFQQKKLEAKMARAVSMLEDPGLRIAEIAEYLQYSSLQHFSSAFKKYYGVSPSVYREKIQRNGKAPGEDKVEVTV